MNYYKNDPYWTKARFTSYCVKCKRQVRKGEDIFYYPKYKAVYCNSDNCGGQESRDFESVVFDEDQYNQGY